jgi:hypothetical protein
MVLRMVDKNTVTTDVNYIYEELYEGGRVGT